MGAPLLKEMRATGGICIGVPPGAMLTGKLPAGLPKDARATGAIAVAIGIHDWPVPCQQETTDA